MKYPIVLYVNAFIKDFLNGKEKLNLRNRKEKLISCSEHGCNILYNPDIQPMMCPHNKFPQKCNKHKRFNCGNLECQTNLLEAKFPQEKRM